jgi:hypothetical protein
MRWLKIRTCAGLAVPMMALSILAGCATEGKVKPALVQEPPVAKGPSVEHLQGGREGFIITEIPKMDEASRRDFDRAVVSSQDNGQAITFWKVIEQSPGVTAPYIDMRLPSAHRQTGAAEEHLKTR